MANEFPIEWYQLATIRHFWFKARFEAFLDFFRSLKTPAFPNQYGLDVGCGNGSIQRQMASKFPWTIDGFDLDPICLTAVPPNNGRNYIYDIRLKNPLFAERYDFIILFDVLEHIPNPVNFLSDLQFYLKPEGILFINVPALEALRSVYDEIAGHIRRYNKRMLAEELKNSKWELIDQSFWGGIFLPLLLARKFWISRVPNEEVIHRGFSPPLESLNSILHRLSHLERCLPFKVPIGTSLLTAAKRRKQ